MPIHPTEVGPPPCHPAYRPNHRQSSAGPVTGPLVPAEHARGVKAGAKPEATDGACPAPLNRSTTFFVRKIGRGRARTGQQVGDLHKEHKRNLVRRLLIEGLEGPYKGVAFERPSMALGSDWGSTQGRLEVIFPLHHQRADQGYIRSLVKTGTGTEKSVNAELGEASLSAIVRYSSVPRACRKWCAAKNMTSAAAVEELAVLSSTEAGHPLKLAHHLDHLLALLPSR